MRHFSLSPLVIFLLGITLIVVPFGCADTGRNQRPLPPTNGGGGDTPGTDETAGEHLPSLTDDTFIENTQDGIVFVDFWAPWCGPCLRMTPIVEKLAKDYTGKVRFYAVNVDNSPKTARQFNINSIPNFIILRNGQTQKSIVGVVPETKLATAIDAVLAE